MLKVGDSNDKKLNINSGYNNDNRYGGGRPRYNNDNRYGGGRPRYNNDNRYGGGRPRYNNDNRRWNWHPKYGNAKMKDGRLVLNKWTNFIYINVDSSDVRFILRSIMLKMGNLDKFEKFFFFLVEIFFRDFNQFGLFLKLLKIVSLWEPILFDKFVKCIDPDKLNEQWHFAYFNALVDKIKITSLTRPYHIAVYINMIIFMMNGEIRTLVSSNNYLKRMQSYDELSFGRYVRFLNYCGECFFDLNYFEGVKFVLNNLHFRKLLLFIFFLEKRELVSRLFYLKKKLCSVSKRFLSSFWVNFEYFLFFLYSLCKKLKKSDLFSSLKFGKFDFNKSLFFVEDHGGLVLSEFGLKLDKDIFIKLKKRFFKNTLYVSNKDLSKPPIFFDDNYNAEFFFKKAINKVVRNFYLSKFFKYNLVIFWFLFFYKRFFYFLILNFVCFLFFLFFFFFEFLFNFFFMKIFLVNNSGNFFLGSYNNGLFLFENTGELFFSDVYCFYKWSSFFFLWNIERNSRLGFRSFIYCSLVSDEFVSMVFDSLYENVMAKKNLKTLRKMKQIVGSLVNTSRYKNIELYLSSFIKNIKNNGDCFDYVENFVLKQFDIHYLFVYRRRR
jgi:hypothetical protein